MCDFHVHLSRGGEESVGRRGVAPRKWLSSYVNVDFPRNGRIGNILFESVEAGRAVLAAFSTPSFNVLLNERYHTRQIRQIHLCPLPLPILPVLFADLKSMELREQMQARERLSGSEFEDYWCGIGED